MDFLPMGTQQLMHLTNGTESSQFYFNSAKFYNHVSAQLLKDVVQLNFSQRYSLLNMLGKGTYAKVTAGPLRSTSGRARGSTQRWRSKSWRRRARMGPPRASQRRRRRS
jgi:hypothetical protein